MHDTEGPDDMSAHIRAMLTGAAAALGTWQGLYLVEHRDRPHRREVVLHVVGA